MSPAQTAQLGQAPDVSIEAYDLYTQSMYVCTEGTVFAADG